MGPGPAGLIQLEEIVLRIINLSVGLAFIALLVILVYGGIKFLTSGGETKPIQSASGTITWALLGILFLALAWLILRLISVFTGIPELLFFDPKLLCSGIPQPSFWCPYP